MHMESVGDRAQGLHWGQDMSRLQAHRAGPRDERWIPEDQDVCLCCRLYKQANQQSDNSH